MRVLDHGGVVMPRDLEDRLDRALRQGDAADARKRATGPRFVIRFSDTKVRPELSGEYECFIDAHRAVRTEFPRACVQTITTGNEYRIWESYAANARGDDPVGKIVRVDP